MNNIKALFHRYPHLSAEQRPKAAPPLSRDRPRRHAAQAGSGVRHVRQPPVHAALHTLQNVRNGSRPMAAGRIWHGPSDNACFARYVLSKTPR